MPKTTQELDARLTRVEQELAQVKASLAKRRLEPWYRQIVGDFAGDKDIVRSSAWVASSDRES